MRKIRIFEHISLDGVIQSSGEANFPSGLIVNTYKVAGPLQSQSSRS